MDDVADYNRKRWQALANADALFTRPYLNLTLETARKCIDPNGLWGDMEGKTVLCLAAGGGQQSAAFALLGANVTVSDLSPEQLENDRMAAAHYRVNIETVQGDMRDLSALPQHAFDIVYQPYALNFVPDASVVFAEVAKVIKPGGIYQFAIANPFTQGVSEAAWNGRGYEIATPYVDGALIEYPDSDWVYDRERTPETIAPPREYRQTLGKVLNSLIALGFVLRHLSDSGDMYPDPNAEPGTWDHCVAFAPPWLKLTLKYMPDLPIRA